jgi:hypothetical protein
LGELLAQIEPFSVELGSVHTDPEGTLLVDVRDGIGVKARIMAWLQNFPELDPSKYPQNHLHISIGYMLPSADGYPADELAAALQACLAEAATVAPVQSRVEHVWLVHYANRTLNCFLGRIRFDLGQHLNPLTVDHLLEALRIASDASRTPSGLADAAR